MSTVTEIPSLCEIPSETTLAERTLLYQYFKDTWAGCGTVVEIGPFLGGTTRAIALGMLQNPRLDATARFLTFDRFDDYYEPKRLRKTIEPLVASGSMSAGEADGLCATGNYLALFHAIHSRHDYGRLITPLASPMPDLPEEIDGSQALAVLRDDRDLTALFIDGCKSWAGTRYAMEFLLPRTRVGAPVIFQDFGWYTCFWISSFTHALEDVLELQQSVDATYIFTLKTAVSAETIAQRFARTPAEMGANFFRHASLALMRRSLGRRDVRGALIAQLHLVAALATIGRKPEAATILKRIDPRQYPPYARMISGACQSPTYRPGGRSILWTET